MSWLKIETAPLNKRRVLVYVPRYGAFTAHFDEEWHVAGLYVPDQPTYWQKLPAPPREEDEP